VNPSVFVCQVFHPDDESTSQLFSELLAVQAGHGHRWEALVGFPATGGKWARCPRTEVWRGVCIRRGGIRVEFKRNLLLRVLSYVCFGVWLGWRLAFCTGRSARVLVVTNPPFAPVLVWMCSRIRGWSYDVFLLDVFPDGLIALGRMAPSNLAARLWRAANRRTFVGARRIFVLGRDMARRCELSYGVPVEKVAYFPHWSATPTVRVQRAEDTALWATLSIDAKFVVQYSGNMGLWHDIDVIIRAAHFLREDKTIHFLMIGRGRRRAAAEALSETLQLTNITWLPFQRRERLEDSLSCCHAAIISQRAGLEGVAVPCKLYGILASGRAVIAQVPADSETAMVVQEEKCGRWIAPGDAAGLARAIKELADDRAATEEMGRRAFAAYQSKYTLEVAAATFQRLLNGPIAESLTASSP